MSNHPMYRPHLNAPKLTRRAVKRPGARGPMTTIGTRPGMADKALHPPSAPSWRFFNGLRLLRFTPQFLGVTT